MVSLTQPIREIIERAHPIHSRKTNMLNKRMATDTLNLTLKNPLLLREM